MPNNQNDVVEIQGKLLIDSSTTDKELQKLISTMKKLEQGPASKLSKDFQALAPVIKGLDKDLYKMLSNFSKTDARTKVKQLTDVLREQANVLRESTKQADEFNSKLKSYAPGSSEYKKTQADLQFAQQKASAAMAGISQASVERDLAQQRISENRNRVISGVGRGVELGGMAIESGMNIFGGEEFRRGAYQARAAAPGQQMAQMMAFNPIAARYMMTKGGLGGKMSAADQAAQGEVEGHMAAGTTRVVGSAISAFGSGNGSGKQRLGQAVTMGGAEALKVFADQHDIALMKDQVVAAKKGEMRQQAMQQAQTMSAFDTSLAQDLAARAPGRVGVSEMLRGAGGYGAMTTGKSNLAGLGFGEGESLQIQGLLAQSGLTSGQRQNVGFFGRGQRAGLGSAEELISGGAQFLNLASNPGAKQAMQEYTEAVKRGILLGFESPKMSRIFTDLSMSMAATSMGKVQDLTGYQAQLYNAAGGFMKGRGTITQGDLQAAATGAQMENQFIGGKNTISLAQNLYGNMNLLKNAGLKGSFSPATAGILSQLTNPDELSDKNSMIRLSLKNQLSKSSGLEGKQLEELTDKTLNQAYQNNLSGNIIQKSALFGQDFSKFANQNTREEFKKRLKAGESGAMGEAAEDISMYAFSTGTNEKTAFGQFATALGFNKTDVKGLEKNPAFKQFQDQTAGTQERKLMDMQAEMDAAVDKYRKNNDDFISGFNKMMSTSTEDMIKQMQKSLEPLSGDLGLPKKVEELGGNIVDLGSSILDLAMAVGKLANPLSVADKLGSWHDLMKSIDALKAKFASSPTSAKK